MRHVGGRKRRPNRIPPPHYHKQSHPHWGHWLAPRPAGRPWLPGVDQTPSTAGRVMGGLPATRAWPGRPPLLARTGLRNCWPKAGTLPSLASCGRPARRNPHQSLTDCQTTMPQYIKIIHHKTGQWNRVPGLLLGHLHYLPQSCGSWATVDDTTVKQPTCARCSGGVARQGTMGYPHCALVQNPASLPTCVATNRAVV